MSDGEKTSCSKHVNSAPDELLKSVQIELKFHNVIGKKIFRGTWQSDSKIHMEV